MLEQAIATIRARIIESALAVLGTLLLSGLPLVEDRLVLYVSTKDPRVLVWTIAVLVAITAYSWAAFFFFKPRIKFDRRLQVYTDLKTGIHYCVSCLDGHNRKAKLIRKNHGWTCAVKECQVSYEDPDNPKPKGPFYIPE